jgi:hypothetical protein
MGEHELLVYTNMKELKLLVAMGGGIKTLGSNHKEHELLVYTGRNRNS